MSADPRENPIGPGASRAAILPRIPPKTKQNSVAEALRDEPRPTFDVRKRPARRNDK